MDTIKKNITMKMIFRSISEKEVAKEPFLVVNKTGELPLADCVIHSL